MGDHQQRVHYAQQIKHNISSLTQGKLQFLRKTLTLGAQTGQEEDQAWELFQQAAKRGHADANVYVGDWYAHCCHDNNSNSF